MNHNNYTNQLIKESSPYLLQHAHNPIDWYPWGAEALEKAKKENKLIVVSIGYSACHWCHVMEKESFEDLEVAEVMNALYVNIKVDREERPDIDQIYMSALQLMNGTGGWPLNCILLPDQRPIYGGTYFKKKDWINILTNIAAMHRSKPSELLDYATKLTDGIKRMELINSKNDNRNYSLEFLNELYQNWFRYLDFDFGGTQGAPKFPVPSNFNFLLKYQSYIQDDKLEYFLKLSLNNIAKLGIYDQIGGGIYRYSVDAYWKIPHFEKMLYDQAQIISLYADAYNKFKNPLYLRTLESCIEFVLTELKNTTDGGFYSALDADSEGVEGKYYCWTSTEISEVLADKSKLYQEYYQFSEEGNFEHGLNHLFATRDVQFILEKHNITELELEDFLTHSNKILLDIRKKKIRPSLDDKQICSWNSLLLSAFCHAYKATLNSDYLAEAISLQGFIENKLVKGDTLYRSYKDGIAKIDAFLDDYAFYIEALLLLYEITSDEKYIVDAERFLKYCINNFHDDQSGLFWYTSEKNSIQLIARKQEFYDSVIPSSNSVMMHNLFKLSILQSNIEYEEIAENMLFSVIENTKRYPLSYSNWLLGFLNFLNEKIEIVIVGENAEAIYKKLLNLNLKNVLILFSSVESNVEIFKSRYINGKTMIYVCKNKSCQMPVESIDEALLQLELK